MDANVETIEENIFNYIIYLDDEHLAAIVNSASAVQLCNIINALLESEDRKTVDSTCIFLQDLVLSSSRNPDCKKFVESNFASAIVPTIESLLFSPNHFIRHQAACILGKTCSYDSLATLDRAFTQFRDSDPLLLPRLKLFDSRRSRV
ncbi:hypothetical protein [Roseofilum casamattae]|uniref:Uncharacterized protein n=1 Tax=Roseofilum casamattae BLCC-M143 TaxID=3022442 RepID=A0ABT7BRG8_9CYAN|nr:hypothetical protein [Roseofilum casamattae]MDJ1181783.1 hypothetical protein [Roseofilum casamattae BLCC-M143]